MLSSVPLQPTRKHAIISIPAATEPQQVRKASPALQSPWPTLERRDSCRARIGTQGAKGDDRENGAQFLWTPPALAPEGGLDSRAPVVNHGWGSSHSIGRPVSGLARRVL